MKDLAELTRWLARNKDKVSQWRAIGIKTAGVLFVSYVSATTVGSLMVLLFIETALPRRSPTRPVDPATAHVMVENKVNYLYLQREIKDRNLFNAEGKFPDEEDPQEEEVAEKSSFDPKAPCRKTTLRLDLVGTIYLGENGPSVASIKDRDYIQADNYRTGDKIIGNEQAKIHKIEHKKVILNNGGNKECLELVPPKIPTGGTFAPVAANTGAAKKPPVATTPEGCSNIPLTEAYVSEQLGPGFANILTKGRLIPQNDDATNQMLGFKLIGVDKKSLFGKMCLRNGDVVTQVNDISMQQPDQGFALYQALQDESEIRVSLLRQGKDPMTITVQIN